MSQMYFKKGTKVIQWRKNGLSTNDVGTIGYPMHKNKHLLKPYLYLVQKFAENRS